jgi:hypothetical protein
MIKRTAPDNTLLFEALADTTQIGFINALVEEYEGMAVMRTLDRKTGHVKFWVPAEQVALLCTVFDDFIQRGWMFSYHQVEPWWEGHMPCAPTEQSLP